MELTAVILAAGEGKRFSGGKLTYPVGGKPMYRHIAEALEGLPERLLCRRIAVVGNSGLMEELACRGWETVLNRRPEQGISRSVRLAVERLGEEDAALFAVCDQPFLEASSVERLICAYLESGKGIGCLSYNGEAGNPVIFSRKYWPELLALKGDRGGKSVLLRHQEDVCHCETDQLQLTDIDRREDLDAPGKPAGKLQNLKD